MAEKEFAVKPVLLRYFCDKAGCDGEVLLDQQYGMLASNPPKYVHSCENCGEVYNFLKAYPVVDYKTQI